MGGGFSHPPDIEVLTSTDGGNQNQWDHWGYVPEGVTTPAQQIAALSYRETASKPWTTYGYYARGMQPTQIFGTEGQGPFQVDGDVGKGYGMPNGYVKGQQFPYKPFQATQADVVSFASTSKNPLCTPDIFPSCTFSQIGDNSIIATGLVPIKNDMTLTYVGNVISDQVDAYRFGNLTYVDSLNSQDTSDYVHPCDGPSFLDLILPPLVGIAAVVAKTRFVDPELAVLGLPSDATFMLNLNTFLAGYYIGKQATLPLNVNEANGYKAAMCIVRGIGYTSTSYFLQNSEMQPGTQLAVKFVSAEILANVIGVPLAVLIDKVVNVGSVPMKIILSVYRTMQRWWCHMTTGTVIACDDAEKFPDARRWAIAELSAKIVDELCAEEGWHRDSPQAQYAMKALLANPGWAMAGMDWGINGSNAQFVYGDTALQNVLWNLTGEIVQSSYEGGSTRGGTTLHEWALDDVQNPDKTSVNNDASGFANSNMIACQQYDILKKGTGKGTMGGDPQLGQNFAANIKRWKEAVRTQAWDPTNWVNAENIGLGKLSGDDPSLMSPQVYLANCNKSLANGGFDDFETRAKYAQLYMQQGTISDEDWMLIQINQYLLGKHDEVDDVNQFAVRLQAAGVTLNLCGCIAYMAREPEDGPQRIFWREWLQSEDAQVKACFGIFHKDALQPPLMRAAPPVLAPVVPTHLGRPFMPFGPGETLLLPFGPAISQLDANALLARFDKFENSTVDAVGVDYSTDFGTSGIFTHDIDAYTLVIDSGFLLQYSNIGQVWSYLQTENFFTMPNNTLGIPQGYAIVYALLYVRPDGTLKTPLTRSWDDFVSAITPAQYHELTQYANPFAQQ